MMQSELLLPSWPALNATWPNLDYDTLHDQEYMILSSILDCNFPDYFPSPNDSSIVSPNSYVDPIALSDEFLDLEKFIDEETPIIEEAIPSNDIEEIFQWINGNYTNEKNSSPMEGDDWSPCLSLESTENSVQIPRDMPLVFPADKMEVNKEFRICHLLKAYGEAIENGEEELAKVIVKSINEKTGPMGNTMERVAYNLFQSSEYLRQESSKNSIAAFKVFYKNLPCGKFAHFLANSAVLGSVPHDAAMVHIIDFDTGEGIQWPPVIESLSRKHKAFRITSVKVEDESTSRSWDFESTKERIQNQAREYGLNVQVEEKNVQDLANELMRMKKRGKDRDFLVFNCMVGLPHMGRRRPRSSVNEFLKVAKELLVCFPGIVILGDGEAGESMNSHSCSSFSSFFDEQLRHYQALFESLERNFPVHLAEARTALESLFLAPLMDPVAWFQDWEEISNSCDIQSGIATEGQKFSHENLAEAWCMISEMENVYSVKIEGLSENEMILRWKETPLVRVSSWM